jgi:hypothetical protein
MNDEYWQAHHERSTPMVHRLTEAQRATLRTLQAQGYSPGDVINARTVFGRHDAQDRGHRQALAGLCRAGVLESAAGKQGVPAWASGVYLVHERTYQALHEPTREQGRGLEY